MIHTRTPISYYQAKLIPSPWRKDAPKAYRRQSCIRIYSYPHIHVISVSLASQFKKMFHGDETPSLAAYSLPSGYLFIFIFYV